MGLVIAAVAVVGGIIYILFVLLSYYSDSARLAQELEVVRMGVDGKRRRLKDYEDRVAVLHDEVPKLTERSDRIRQWIDLLKSQRAHLDTDRTNSKLMSHQERKAVVAKGMTDRRRGRQE